MSRRRWALRGLGAAAIAVALGLLFQAPIREAIQRTWYLHKLESGTPRERQDAAFRLARMHAVQAIPALVRIGREEWEPGEQESFPYWVTQALVGIGRPGIEAAFASFRDEEKLAKVFEALREMGQDGAIAIPALEALLRDEAHGDDAAEALLAMGEPGLAVLLGALKCPHAGARGNAAFRLGFLERPPAIVASALALALKDPVAEVRYAAARGLSVLGRASKDALPQLIEALSDQETDVRVEAAVAISRVGPQALEAMPALIRALRNSSTAWLGKPPLAEIDPKGESAVPALLDLLRNGAKDLRIKAAQLLEDFPLQVAVTVPALAAAIHDSDPQVRVAAAAALGNLKEHSRPALPQLHKALKDEYPRVAIAAALALARMEEFPEDAIPVLLRSFLGNSNPSKNEAEEALNRYKHSELERFLPQILPVLKDTSPLSRIKAARLLGKSPTAGGEAVAVLIKVLEDPQGEVRQAAVEALGELGPGAVRAVGLLLKLSLEPTSSIEFRIKYEAELALFKLGTTAIPALLAAMEDPNIEVRRRSLSILGRFTSPSPVVLSAIGKSLRDPSPRVRWAALDACRELKGAAASFAPAIRNLLAETEPRIQADAAQVLFRLTGRPEDVLSTVQALLKQQDWYVRRSAMELAGALGAAGAPVVPALSRTVSDETLRTERSGQGPVSETPLHHAIVALGQIGPAAVSAISALENLRRSTYDADFHKAIDDALRSIRGGPARP